MENCKPSKRDLIYAALIKQGQNQDYSTPMWTKEMLPILQGRAGVLT